MRQRAKFGFRYALVLSLTGLLVGSASSQTQSPPLSKDQIRVTTNEVIVPVTVTDSSGEFVLDLEQKDFQVFDDGAAQQIDHWELGGDPLAVALLIDTSAHLRAFEPAIHRMGSIFTETVMAFGGEAAVITYDSTVDVRQPFTEDHDAVQKAIEEAKFEAPEMMLYDAMAASVALLKAEPPTRRRIMLILGESQDSGSAPTLGQVVRDAENANIAIYAVGPSSIGADLRSNNKEATPLKVSGFPTMATVPCIRGGHQCFDLATPAMRLLELGTNEIKNHQLEVAAAATGGIHYRAFRDSTLRAALDKVGAELHAQYMLSYRPNGERASGVHAIKVTVSRADLKVRTRPGYYLAPTAN
jgi:VWFA-related protein